jgi:serine/threonine-protein kinase HipA
MKRIEVYIDGLYHQPVQVGLLTAELLKGREVFSFSYHEKWLECFPSLLLDPDLQFYSGRQYPLDATKSNFGLFMDSSPDRWGRKLMERREIVQAKIESRKPRKLFESDYLLGVYDENRQGALRFKLEGNSIFLNDDQQMAAPPFASLRELEAASLRLEEDNTADNSYNQWLNLLIAPGSSLGGARPKASVKDVQENLWIAKFPSKADDRDVGGWEMVIWQLAQKAGINMAPAVIKKFNHKQYHTFLTKRFDRNGTKRIHFASAMTMLGLTDGADAAANISYLHIAEWLIRNSKNPSVDLLQLWKRIVFSILVSNTDDHLRNHGFLLTDGGWELSPAYDINPSIYRSGLSLNITENDNSLEPELAIEVASDFRIKHQQAKQLLAEIQAVVATWQKVATQIGISRSEQEQMSPAFFTT